MRAERVLRDAAAPLIGKLVPPLELEDLHQEGRIALWLKGEGLPDSHKVTIARGAMIDALRRARWASRGDYGQTAMAMDNYDGWGMDAPEGTTDCESASWIAVGQCIAKMATFPARDQRLINCLVDGMSKDEAAKYLGVSAASVSRIVCRLRRDIVSELEVTEPTPTIEATEEDRAKVVGSGNASGYKGVRRNGDKFVAQIKVAQRTIHIGTFTTPEDAHAAYMAARRRYFPSA